MRIEIGHTHGSRIVHLTHTTLVSEALCGESLVGFLGEPDIAVICDACDEIGHAAGADRTHWLRSSRVLTLVEIEPEAIATPRAA